MDHDSKSLERLVLEILQTTWPNREKMKYLIGRELRVALTETGKIDGYYTLSKTIASIFVNVAGISLSTIKEFASYMPGGFVASNPFYNTLLIYILTFCADGDIDDVVYSIARLYTAITVSYAKKKYFPILNASLLQYTLVNAHGATVAKQGFSAMVLKMADETLNKYIDVFKSKVDLYSYYRFIVDIHNKVNQSMKHIAFRYYANTGKVITDDVKVKLESAMSNVDKVITNVNAIEFISRTTGVVESEVEDICFRLKNDGDSESYLQNIVLRLLRQYGGKEGINNIGVNIAIGRCLVMVGMQDIAKNLLEFLGVEVDKNRMKVIFTIGLLCIMFSE